MAYLGRIYKSIGFIEDNLKNDISLSEIAYSASFSPFHFHRIFHAVTGENVKEYIRRRRITEAANELLNTDKGIFEIALDYRFDTQESFTRTFKKLYKVTPGKYRKEKKPFSILGKKEITFNKLEHYKDKVTMEPKIITKDSFKVIGMSCRTTMKDNKIPQLWLQFIKRMGEIKNQTKPGTSYGICENESGFDYREFQDDTEFTEFVGVEVNSFEEVPDGMLTKVISTAKYALFTHKGKLDSLQTTYDYIYGTWLNHSGYELANTPDFELYDARFLSPDNPASEMDIYVPIKYLMWRFL